MTDELTEEQIKLLSESIPIGVWTSIALAQLGLNRAQIENLKEKHHRDMEAVSRDLITRWRDKPSKKGESGEGECRDQRRIQDFRRRGR